MSESESSSSIGERRVRLDIRDTFNTLQDSINSGEAHSRCSALADAVNADIDALETHVQQLLKDKKELAKDNKLLEKRLARLEEILDQQ